MRFALAVAVVLTATSCSSGAGSTDRGTTVPATQMQSGAADQRTDATEPAAVGSEAVEVDLDDPRPVIVSGWRWLALSYPQPVDLPQFSIYPDGRVIGVRVSESPFPQYAAYDLELSASQFQELLELAGAVGLEGGGLQPEVPLPDGVGVEDGGNYYFAVRSNDELTARVVEQPSEIGLNGDETVPDRVAYLDLFGALVPLFADLNQAAQEDRSRLALRRWAIVSTPLAVDGVLDNDVAWTGPDLDEVAWLPIAGGSLCAIVEDDDWPLEREDEKAGPLVIDSRLVSRRPLLPHEQSCDDVSEMRQALELDDVTRLGDPSASSVHSTDRWTGGVDGPVIFGRSNRDAEEALATGTVQLRNGCLVLEAPEADNTASSALIVWKYGTGWVNDRSAISLRPEPDNVSEVVLGEVVELGGGFHSIETLGGFVNDPQAIANITKCLSDTDINQIFVNQ